jgi:hypothetical protein
LDQVLGVSFSAWVWTQRRNSIKVKSSNLLLAKRLRGIVVKVFSSVIMLSGLLACASLAQAGPITYTLTVTTIGSGTVTGSITTDGTLGTLTDADIIDWNIALKPNPGTPFTLFGPLSGNNSGYLSSGSNLSATATQLAFDFSLDGFSLFQNPAAGSSINYICFAGNGTLCGNFNGPSINDGTDVFGVNTQTEPLSSVVIGAAAGVPEPSTVGMLGLGLIGLGFARRFRA